MTSKALCRSGPAQQRRLRLALAILLLAAPRAARAQTSGAADPSAELFREGRQLINEGRIPEACQKFRASLELRRSPGTLLNVGNCLEAEGQLTSALAAFEDTLKLAEGEPDARKVAVWTAAARKEIAALEPRIARLQLTTPPGAGLRVSVDGQVVSDLGQVLRLDPGRHSIEATAPGKRPFSRVLELAEGQRESLSIPELEPLPAEAVKTPAPAPSRMARAPSSAGADPAPDASNPAAWWLVGAGGAVFAGGAVVGLVALGMNADLKDECPNKSCTGDLSQRDRTFTTAVVADVLMAAGLVSAAAGSVWLLTSDTDAPAPLSAGCGPTGCAATWSGRF